MFSRTASAIERILDAILIVTLVVMVASIAYQVFGRYVLDHAPGWTAEVSRLLMAWITMLGSAAVIRSEGHIAVPVLADALPPTLRQAVRWLRDAIIVTMAGALVWYGYGYALIGARRSSPALEISMYWPGLAIPVGAAFIALLLVLHRLSRARGDRG